MQSLSPNKIALAVDLGTTTIAASLIDPATGERLAVGGSLNPQRSFGADVLTRLGAAVASPDALSEMSRLVNAELSALAVKLCSSSGLTLDKLSRVVIAGNPAMEHLLLGIPVDSLVKVPYRPVFTNSRRINTGQLGWGFSVDAYLFPLPGGFVGGDLVAVLFGLLQDVTSLTSHVSHLFLDLGTNAEIALVTPERIYATSAAAGPAFEGGNLSCGMPALPGAISEVTIVADRLSLSTVDGVPPLGICGTGALSAIAAFLENGVMERHGRLLSPSEVSSNLANRLIDRAGELAFLLHRDARHELFLTQTDIRQLQLAKAAVRSGIEMLFERADVAAAGMHLTVTGSFGSAISAELLLGLGFLPNDPVGINVIANGVLVGAEHFLVRGAGDDEIDGFVQKMKIVPLSGNPRFETLFINAIDF